MPSMTKRSSRLELRRHSFAVLSDRAVKPRPSCFVKAEAKFSKDELVKCKYKKELRLLQRSKQRAIYRALSELR